MHLSIIIATCNRAAFLKTVLSCLKDQLKDCPEDKNMEVMIVDNRSVDITREVVREFIEQDKRFKYLYESQKGKTHALNSGISRTSGEFIAFLDDDVLLEKPWLGQVFYSMENYQFDAMGGRIIPEYPRETPRWVQENAGLLTGPIVRHDHGDVVEEYNETMDAFWGANILLRREALMSVGLFNTKLGPGLGTYGEDTDLYDRLKQKGKKVIYNGRLLIKHPVEKERMSLAYFAKWKIQAGRYYAQMDLSRDLKLKTIGGVPRYLFPRLARGLVSMAGSIFQRASLLKSMSRFFISLGMTQGYYQARSIRGSQHA